MLVRREVRSVAQTRSPSFVCTMPRHQNPSPDARISEEERLRDRLVRTHGINLRTSRKRKELYEELET